MDYNEMARMVDRDELSLVIPLTVEPDPRVIPMTPAPMHQPIRWNEQPQSRAEWEARNWRPRR